MRPFWRMRSVTLVLVLRELTVILCIPGDIQGPHFLFEPPHKVEFSNSSGAKIDCTAHSNPRPKIEWILADGSPVTTIPSLRLVSQNGTLTFPPFSPDLYRPDVHNAVYKCRVSNVLGSIVSRDVHARGVVKQKYEVQVYDEYAISSNTAVLRCQVPSYAAEFVIVTSWIQEDVVNIYPSTDTGGKFAVMSNGDLYVYDTQTSDAYKSYACRTVHKLTGEVQASSYSGRIIVTEPKGAVQPRIRVEKHSRKQVKIGEDIILSCLAQGYPLPTYRWFKEESQKLSSLAKDERISADEKTGLLRITKAKLEDKGKYVCRINNSVGEEAVQVTLTVTAPLSVHILPPNQIVDVGKEAVLLCSPSGYPVTRVTWLRDGQPLVADTRYKIESSPQRLNIYPVVKEDAGMYQCFVYNEWDQSEAAAELQLGDASPELTYVFSEQTLQPGPPISLKCVATGNPPPQFTWTLDGFSIPDSTRFLVGQYVTIHDDVVSHVNVTNVNVEDGGKYACIAKNTVSSVSHSARINIYGSPFIRIMPKISAVSGSDLVIHCPVAGYPIESVTWERDGNVLPMNRRQRVYTNGTLIVEQAQRTTDDGTYTCQAQNRQKQTARRNVEVQVLLPPKILPIQAMTNLLREGMRAAIPCQVLEGDLPLTFKWQRNGQSDLGSGAAVRRLDEYSTSLVIEKIQSSHSANYTCTVQNRAGSESFTVPLTVSVPPRWTIEPMDVNVVLGNDLMLNCQAEGYPEPNVVWKKAVGDHPGEYKDFLYEPNINLYKNGSVEFAHITKDSEGHFLCEAKNGISNGVSKVIFVKVNTPAYFPQKNKQVYVEKGGQAHLQCTALGDNPISIMWKVGPQRVDADLDQRYTIREQRLDEGMVSELGITRVFRHDTGVLTCFASNSFGQDEMTIQLIVQEPPELPKNVRVMAQQSRSLQVSWTQPYGGNSPITSYIVQYKLTSETWDSHPSKVTVPGTQAATLVSNLLPAHTYHIRILAENNLGMSEPSEVIQSTTQEEVPSSPPRDVQTEAKSSTELIVRWEAPPKENWNGQLLGYYVAYAEYADSVISTSTSLQNPRIRTVDVGEHFEGRAELAGLSKYTVYSISVQAFNSKGGGPSSEPVAARTKEGVPTLPPEEFVCITTSSTSLEVSWEPPPVEGRNGQILGYKLAYFPADEDWYGEVEEDAKSTASLKTMLSSLLKFTNYSVSVLACTSAGEGVSSSPIYCKTGEDIPSPPADIKAVVANVGKAIVSWMPPIYPNGDLTGYTMYMGMIESGNEGGTHKHEISPSKLVFELSQIQEGTTYQFWVTASTKIGESSGTRVVTITPNNKIPARIISFSREITTPWKQNVSLPCRTVGAPMSKLLWQFEGKNLDMKSRRYTIVKTGMLIIKDIQYPDSGNYTCTSSNQHGEDTIFYRVIVRVPPDPPVLSIINAETESLLLKWSIKGNIGLPILGYVINYKKDQGDWEEIHIGAREASHLLQNLWCGTRYQLYITAFNKIGTGLPCDIVNAYTKGTAPNKPAPGQLLTVNSTAISIWLDVWDNGGCAILYFTVEYREDVRSDWIRASNHIQALEKVFSLSDLQPATRYFVSTTAFNNAGSTKVVYNVTTLALDGTPVVNPTADSVNGSFQLTSRIVWALSLIVLSFAFIFIGCFYLKKKKGSPQPAMGESATVARLQNQQNRDQQYAVHQPNNAMLNIDCPTYKTDSTEYIEDVCPYATFQLAKQPYPESTFSGNVYSGPYHSVRGSFVYRDVPSNQDTYKGRHSKEPEYTKVRRKPARLRDPNSESQESDNLGSTDSEVKKILSLHLPISEYDTHGSDSELEIHPMSSSQDMVPFRHRISRPDVSKADESSSSSERSPTNSRKCPHSRKIKMKQPSFKKLGRSSSGYSSHNEETTFSYSDRINPPSRFSDQRYLPRELNEIECDTNKLGVRRGSRGSAAGASYRLSRESSFQIDV